MAPPPPPANFPAAHQALQFLSTALSQRGPSALPYAEDTKWLIRQHLVSLLHSHPSLRPKISSFTHNDGRTVNLLQAAGTLPIIFSGAVYNIPASIWLLERYPLLPPSVFLNPTRDMIIKLNHPHVDRSGLVHVPYLKNWIYPSSNLLDLVRSLSRIFSIDPPLFSRQNPNPNSSENVVKKIVEMVHADGARLREVREGEMEGLLGTQAALRRREAALARGVREMVGEKEGLEQMLQIVVMNVDVVEGWVRENEGKWLVDVGEDDAGFEPADDLSREMLDCAAEDLAVEDTVYCLDKALQSGAIPLDVYLKNVRALSREQFYRRALATKVRAAQVASMVGRASMCGS